MQLDKNSCFINEDLIKREEIIQKVKYFSKLGLKTMQNFDVFDLEIFSSFTFY